MFVVDFSEVEGEVIFTPSERYDSTIMEIDALVKAPHYDIDVSDTDDGGISLSVPMFISHFSGILEILSEIDPAQLNITDSAREFITWVRELMSAPDTLRDESTEDDIQTSLDAAGWNNETRSLSKFQMQNLLQTTRRDNAAIFSVPGAGKTVEALAYSTVVAGPDALLIVVCPRNAYMAWEIELKACLGVPEGDILRAMGTDGDLRAQLMLRDSPPKAVLVNYNRLWYRHKVFSEYIRRMTNEGHKVITIFDESHHFKGGKSFTSAVMRVSPFASHRMLLSGTPMPRAASDLVHQFRALLPYAMGDIEEENVHDVTLDRFVRTTKEDLGLREPIIEYRTFQMDTIQSNMYELLTDFYAAEHASRGSKKAFAELIRLQRILIYLVMHVSNPCLIDEKFLSLLSGINPELAEQIKEKSGTYNDYGPKIRYACERARELAAEGKKVIIWSSFVDNVASIAAELEDLGAVYIRGDVPTSEYTTEGSFSQMFTENVSEEQERTREQIIHRFKTQDDCMVLVANPAAAGEGISLHDVCHHAIYVDRTFHATEFMQSMDRIHRYGRDENGDVICAKHDTTIEILQCENSVDITVDSNLRRKMTAMYDWLNDPSLSPQLRVLDPMISEEEFAEIASNRSA